MKYYDLTVALFHNCPGWPTNRRNEFSYEAVHCNDNFIGERIDMNTHTGTHLDAPYHFFPDGVTIDEIPLESFIGHAHLIDLKGIKARTGIGEKELESKTGDVKKGDIVLMRTGWAEKRSFSAEYCHDWPYLSKEGAQLLLDKGVKGVGIDAMSMGGWYEGTGRPCHEILLGNGIWLAEELFFPEELMRHKTCTFTAVPLKLKGFGGSPTRAFAVTND